jgi:hypothetical protein
MAKLEREGRLFGAGLLKNDKDNETTSDLGYGYFDQLYERYGEGRSTELFARQRLMLR